MEQNQRHGCITVWLVFLVVANLVVAFLNYFAEKIFGFELPDNLYGHFTLLIILGVLNVFFALALLKRKLWGFYGFIGTALVTFGINFDAGVPLQFCFAGMVGIIVLFAVLQIRKNDVSEWDIMENRKENEAEKSDDDNWKMN